MKAYGSGRLSCTCDGDTSTTTRRVLKAPVSNSKLLSVAGVGFGGGVATMAVAALLYLAVTKIKSSSKEKERSRNEMFNMGFN